MKYFSFVILSCSSNFTCISLKAYSMDPTTRGLNKRRGGPKSWKLVNGGPEWTGVKFRMTKSTIMITFSKKSRLVLPLNYKKWYLTYLFAALKTKTGTKIVLTLGKYMIVLSSKFETFLQIDKRVGPNKVRRWKINKRPPLYLDP